MLCIGSTQKEQVLTAETQRTQRIKLFSIVVERTAIEKALLSAANSDGPECQSEKITEDSVCSASLR